MEVIELHKGGRAAYLPADFGIPQAGEAECRTSPGLTFARPTVTGVQYDDILWKIEWLCEEALMSDDDNIPLAAVPEWATLPDGDIAFLAAAQARGIKALQDAAFSLLGEPDERGKSRTQKAAKPGVCIRCFRQMEVRTSGRKQKFCGASCRVKYWSERRAEKVG